jgi:hypothetical protein
LRFGWGCRGSFDLDSPPFDWGADYKKPNIPFNDLVIYEAAVRGFTAHESSKLGPLAGSFLGVAAKIDHLKELGINAIELLPVRGAPGCLSPTLQTFVSFAECVVRDVNPNTACLCESPSRGSAFAAPGGLQSV